MVVSVGCYEEYHLPHGKRAVARLPEFPKLNVLCFPFLKPPLYALREPKFESILQEATIQPRRRTVMSVSRKLEMSGEDSRTYPFTPRVPLASSSTSRL